MKRKFTLLRHSPSVALPVFAQDQPQITPRVAPTAKESRAGSADGPRTSPASDGAVRNQNSLDVEAGHQHA